MRAGAARGTAVLWPAVGRASSLSATVGGRMGEGSGEWGRRAREERARGKPGGLMVSPLALPLGLAHCSAAQKKAAGDLYHRRPPTARTHRIEAAPLPLTPPSSKLNQLP